jgi:hypothetical protein
MLFPIISPKERAGTPRKAELTPTKRFGKEEATAITKKATTNSVTSKYLAIFKRPTVISSPAKYKKPQETIKIVILKNHSIRIF